METAILFTMTIVLMIWTVILITFMIAVAKMLRYVKNAFTMVFTISLFNGVSRRRKKAWS